MNRQQQIEHFIEQAHVIAMARLRATPSRMDEVWAQLSRWRAISGETRSNVYWKEWESLLVGSIDALAESVCASGDHATVLRSVSPMSVLITQAERAQLLHAARHAP